MNRYSVIGTRMVVSPFVAEDPWSADVGEHEVASGGDVELPAVQDAGGEESPLDDGRTQSRRTRLLIQQRVDRDLVDLGGTRTHLPGSRGHCGMGGERRIGGQARVRQFERHLSLIHISEPTRQAEISYAVFCLKKKKA